MSARLTRNAAFRAVLVTSLALLLALGFISYTALTETRAVLLAQLAQKAGLEVDQTARRVDHALELGIPLQGIVGFDRLFVGLRETDAEIAFLAIVARDGSMLHAAGLEGTEITAVLDAPARATEAGLSADQSLRAGHLVARQALSNSGSVQAEVVLGYRESAIDRPLRDNLLDVLIILLAVLLLSFEVLLLLFTVHAVLPARTALRVLRNVAHGTFNLVHGQILRDEMGRAMARLNQAVRIAAGRVLKPEEISEPRVIGVRLLAFLFVFAEELARPIMPTFFRQVAAGVDGVPTDAAIGWVLGAHMLTVALVMPLASLYYERIGRRRMYVAGALLATAGLVGTGLAQGLWDLIAWRALSGCGYAITFTACQGFVLENTDRSKRSQGIAMMVGGIMLADICGPAIGGVLAGQIGARPTFLAGACMALLAALLVSVLMGRAPPRFGRRVASGDAPARIGWATITETLRNPLFLLVLFLIAAPAKFLLSGYLYLLVPIHLTETGSDVAEIGRVLMVYGVVALFLGPVFARLADRMGRHALVAGAGGMIAGLGLSLAVFGAGLPVMLAGVAMLGIGQALSIPAQVSAAIDVSGPAIRHHGQGAVMAVMRLVERLAGGIGPIATAALAHHIGLERAMVALGIASLAMGALFLLLFPVMQRLHGKEIAA